MAININDKEYLIKTILPNIEISNNAMGISVSSDRLNSRRFIPYDKVAKRGRKNKLEEPDYDSIVCKEGVYVWSNRIQGSRFIPFDYICDLPNYTFIKVRTKKGRVANIPHGTPPTPLTYLQNAPTCPLSQPSPLLDVIEEETGFQESIGEGQKDISKKPRIDNEPSSSAQPLFHILSAATTNASSAVSQLEKEEKEKNMVDNIKGDEEQKVETPKKDLKQNFMEEISAVKFLNKEQDQEKVLAEEFMESVAAATTLLDVNNEAESKELASEFMESISAATTFLETEKR